MIKNLVCVYAMKGVSGKWDTGDWWTQQCLKVKAKVNERLCRVLCSCTNIASLCDILRTKDPVVEQVPK